MRRRIFGGSRFRKHHGWQCYEPRASYMYGNLLKPDVKGQVGADWERLLQQEQSR